MAIRAGSALPERMEKHERRNWVDKSFNHKTTLTMGTLVPLAVKHVYPGELVKLYLELQAKFAALYLPIMHQCYWTLDWFYVRTGSLFEASANESFEDFMKQDPVTGTIQWAYFNYKRADAVFTDGILNYMGFNAPPGAGTLIFQTKVSAIPVAAYNEIWRWHFRNSQIQENLKIPLVPGDNTGIIESNLPDLRVKRRNWPRDYYTSATLSPQQGENVLIPSFATDPETGEYLPQRLFKLDGDNFVADTLGGTAISGYPAAERYLTRAGDSTPLVLQLSATIRDFRYAAHMTEFLERHMRSGGFPGGQPQDMNWNDFVKRNFDWNPNPLMIGQPIWIGGYTGNIIISEVMATAESGDAVVGDYAGKAIARDNTPVFKYTIPDYGVIIPMLTVYPKASYYSGSDRIWNMETKMDYMWEQFALIGDQPMKNKEVWFSWYDADIAWNDEIFGYTQQYNWERYSNDIVSGQMRTLWESFHLGRKFAAAGDVILNSDFVTCNPDIGRVFVVDAEAGEHECFIHAYVGIEILRRLPKFGLPEL